MLTSFSYTIPPSMLMASHIVNGIIPHTTQYVSHGRAQCYFEYTWIGTTGQSSLFPPSAWNHHDASLALLPRSSNMAEGWHNGFRSLVCSIMSHMLTSISYTIYPSMLMASHIVNGITPHTTQYVSHGRAQWYLSISKVRTLELYPSSL